MQILQDGYENMDMRKIIKTIIIPISNNLLSALCIPYFISRAIIPWFGVLLLLVGWVGWLVGLVGWVGWLVGWVGWLGGLVGWVGWLAYISH